jgi:hypothetical protein
LAVLEVDILLVAAVDENCDSGLVEIAFLHVHHFPALRADCIDNGPDDVKGVLEGGYFGTQVGVEIEVKGASVKLVEEVVLHHEEGEHDVGLGFAELFLVEEFLNLHDRAGTDGIPDGLDVLLAPFLEHQLQSPRLGVVVQLHH